MWTKRIGAALFVALIASSSTVYGVDVINENNAGYDRFFQGPWSGAGNFIGWRDNVAFNGDTWLGTNGQFVSIAPYGAGDGNFGDPAAVGVYGGSTGDTKEVQYDITADLDNGDSATTSTTRPLMFLSDVKNIVHRIATDRSSRLRHRVSIGGSGVDLVDIAGNSSTHATSAYFVTADIAAANAADETAGLIINMDPGSTLAESGDSIDGEEDLNVGAGAALGYDPNTGTFATVTDGDAINVFVDINENDDGGYGQSKNIGLGTKLLRLVEALPGDSNFDGNVDLTDASALLATFGNASGEVWHTGDFTGDGAVDLSDASELLSGFGQTLLTPSAAPAAATAPIPEPASIGLIGLGALALIRRRR